MENNEMFNAEEAAELNGSAASEACSSNETKPQISMDLKDMISSIFIALFGLYVLISGVHMSVVSQQMSDTAWYGTPGILPIVIGTVLVSLSTIMFVSAYRKGERINKELFNNALIYLKSKNFLRLAVAVGLLGIYVFIMFPYLPFMLATAIYLIANMVFFRTDNFPIWKIVVISLVFSVALYLFFSQVAGVPLR